MPLLQHVNTVVSALGLVGIARAGAGAGGAGAARGDEDGCAPPRAPPPSTVITTPRRLELPAIVLQQLARKLGVLDARGRHERLHHRPAVR